MHIFLILIFFENICKKLSSIYNITYYSFHKDIPMKTDNYNLIPSSNDQYISNKDYPKRAQEKELLP